MIPTDKEQKFIIENNGDIKMEWINVLFSDTVIELLPEKQKQQIKELSKETGIEPKIYCG